MSQLHKLIVVAFLGITFNAKPMQQTVNILEETSSYLAKYAPEIAAIGGIILKNSEDRPDVYSPRPMMEEVRYDSSEISTLEDAMDIPKNIIENENNYTKEQKKSGGCDLF